MISQKEIVVAKYDENLDWLRTIRSCKITIYNKGNDVLTKSVTLPNTGRESHTYFYHIVENYDNLSDWTFFTQGHPFDHVKDFVEIVNNWDRNKPNVINIEDKGFFFSNGVFNVSLKSNESGRPYHSTILNINKLWSSIFECKPLKEYEFSAGCIFCIHKDLILKRDKTFYQTCLSLSETIESSPWEYERIMQYIFNNNFK